jgi:small nuclear ribonucleoprotein (snRNP)-like protein
VVFFVADLKVLKLVELKNGETFNGHLIACDNFMNVTLKDAYETSAVRLCWSATFGTSG